MKLIVSGKTKDFTPELREKFAAKISKVTKLIERRGEREAHVNHQVQRHLHRVEVIINFYDHSLVGEGVNADLDIALCEAVEKIEKQIVKITSKWRDTHRDPKATRSTKEEWDSAPRLRLESKAALAEQMVGNGRPAKPKVFRVDYNEDRKPMTLQEALLEMERDKDDYVVYRDAGKNCLSVLVRRTDGNFDLIES
jgi:ribosome hibernation promoting factor